MIEWEGDRFEERFSVDEPRLAFELFEWANELAGCTARSYVGPGATATDLGEPGYDRLFGYGRGSGAWLE